MNKIKRKRNTKVEGIIKGRILIWLDFNFSFGDNCIPQCFYYFPNYFKKHTNNNFFGFLSKRLPHEKACDYAVFFPASLRFNLRITNV